MITNFATLNVRGCKSTEELRKLAMDALNYNTKIITISETHIPLEEEIYEISVENKSGKKGTYVIYTVNSKGNHHHGVGILVEKNLNPTFTKVTERICTATIIYNNNLFITVVATYAPTTSNCDKEPKIRDAYYAQL